MRNGPAGPASGHDDGRGPAGKKQPFPVKIGHALVVRTIPGRDPVQQTFERAVKILEGHRSRVIECAEKRREKETLTGEVLNRRVIQSRLGWPHETIRSTLCL